MFHTPVDIHPDNLTPFRQALSGLAVVVTAKLIKLFHSPKVAAAQLAVAFFPESCSIIDQDGADAENSARTKGFNGCARIISSTRLAVVSCLTPSFILIFASNVSRHAYPRIST